MNKFNLAAFENHWDLLLRDCAKETQIHNSDSVLWKRILSNKQKHQLRHNNSKHVSS